MMHRKLRLGLWLDAMTVPVWVSAMLERLHGSPYAEIRLIVHSGSTALRRPRWQWHTLVYDLFHALDRRLWLWKGQRNAFAPRHLDTLLKYVPLHKVRPASVDGGSNLSVSDTEAIRLYDLDVLIDLGAGEPIDTMYAIPSRYGVWSYQHDIEASGLGFWEVMRKRPIMHTQVNMYVGSRASKQVVFQAAVRTYPWSPWRSRQDVSWKAASFLPRQLERLHRLGAEAYLARAREISEDAAHDEQLDGGVPSNSVALMLILVYLARFAKRLLEKLWMVEQWFLLYDIHPQMSTSLCQFKALHPPKDREWADPHVVAKDGQYYVFFEELIFRRGPGHIAVLILDQNGQPQGEPQIVLKRDYHLSYPHIFTHHDTWYMIPETMDNKTIELYECVEFPHVWRHTMNLLEDIQAVDSTVLFHHGKWWLFTSLADSEASPVGDELFLFYADDLFTTQWQPHALNPIVSDVRHARLAGGILQIED